MKEDDTYVMSFRVGYDLAQPMIELSYGEGVRDRVATIVCNVVCVRKVGYERLKKSWTFK